MASPGYNFDPLNSSKSIIKKHVHLIGFEFDGTACFRKGARFGPNEIRKKSPGIETYSPYLLCDTEDSYCVDIGNLPVGSSSDIELNWQKATDYFRHITKDIDFKEEGVKFLTLGGEHSISYGPIVSYLNQYNDLLLIHLDAHADLRDGYEGYHYSHASIIRRCLDHFGDDHQLAQYGIRSGTADEYQWMKKNQTLFTSKTSFLEFVSTIDSHRPIYLSLDLDYFDPSFLPGTGTPEPGGEDFGSFIQLIKILKDKNFVGADVVELAPTIDPTENSSVFAAKVVRELLLTLHISGKNG